MGRLIARYSETDCKQANVLLDGDLQARLTDFGLAGVMHHTVGFTTASVLQGSIRWMSYELLGFETSPSRPTMHSDIWALAVVWWEVSQLALNRLYPPLTSIL